MCILTLNSVGGQQGGSVVRTGQSEAHTKHTQLMLTHLMTFMWTKTTKEENSECFMVCTGEKTERLLTSH